jgi:hypothetical protein
MTLTPFEDACRLLKGAGTWHEFKTSLAERRLDLALGAADMDLLRRDWQAQQAQRMDDNTLTRELRFWAEGGSYDSHLDGFQALSPGALLVDAQRRGWFVRRLASGAVVNAPIGKPLMLRGLDVIAPPDRV